MKDLGLRQGEESWGRRGAGGRGLRDTYPKTGLLSRGVGAAEGLSAGARPEWMVPWAGRPCRLEG